MKTIQRIGILLAAGRGRRMGGEKQFFPCPTSEGEKPLVLAAFDAIASVCDAMIVVLGHRGEEVLAALADRRFHAVRSNPDGTMYESVRVGLRLARDIHPTAKVLLHPGDHPRVAKKTLSSLLAAAEHHPDRAVFPEYAERGGHPAIIPPWLAQRLTTAECPWGLRQWWVDNPHLCLRVRVDDATVVEDIDFATDSPN